MIIQTLLENRMEDDFFDRYEVVCIVGTLNPNIDNIKFIPVEELNYEQFV